MSCRLGAVLQVLGGVRGGESLHQRVRLAVHALRAPSVGLRHSPLEG